MATEGYESLGVEAEFPAETTNDEILNRFGDPEMIANMQQVFFGEAPNALGHSYAKLIRGPYGRNDLEDVIELLRQETWTKRAVVTLCGAGNGKVPCINVIQFLIRHGAVHAFYFARGQDAYRKFYADGLCVASMTRKVAEALQLPAGSVTGFIGSCHIYHQDLPAISKMLEAVKHDLVSPDSSDLAASPLVFPTRAVLPGQSAKSNQPMANRSDNQSRGNGHGTMQVPGGTGK